MKKVGIWLDTREALLFWDGKSEVEKMTSDIDEGHVHGGYGGSTKHLPQDAVSDTKLTAYKEEQIKKYFDRVADAAGSANEIYILGPGEIRKRFGKHLTEHTDLGMKVLANKALDSVTENQMWASFRSYFDQ